LRVDKKSKGKSSKEADICGNSTALNSLIYWLTTWKTNYQKRKEEE
jgi:hypothetical protein